MSIEEAYSYYTDNEEDYINPIYYMCHSEE